MELLGSATEVAPGRRTWSRDSRDTAEGNQRRTTVENNTQVACSLALFPPKRQMSVPPSSPAPLGLCLHASAHRVEGANRSPYPEPCGRARAELPARLASTRGLSACSQVMVLGYRLSSSVVQDPSHPLGELGPSRVEFNFRTLCSPLSFLSVTVFWVWPACRRHNET